MDAPELSYKKDNWCLHLLDATRRFQSEEVLCDTLIVTQGGGKTMAHSCILAAASDHLASSVLQPPRSSIPRTLHVNASLSSVQKVIEFVYSGEVLLQGLEMLNEVSKAAKELQIEALESWCSELQMSYQETAPYELSESRAKSESIDEFLTVSADENSTQPQQTDNIRGVESQPMVKQLQPAKSTLLNNQVLPSPTHAESRPFNCAHCDMSFVTKSNLTRHLRCHSGQKPFICKQCGAAFSRADILKRHEFSHTPDNRPTFKCSLCEKTFSREHGLKLHEEYHKNPSKNECSVCHKTYADVKNLRDHMLTHDLQKKFACQTCGRQFISKKRLLQHEKIHRKDRPRKHECTLCQKKFFSRQALECHQTVHSGDKPFKCEFCSQRFSQYSNCYAHEKLHSGKKDFVCETCGAAFAKHNHLKEHRLIHNEKKIYECESCDKSFRQMRNLKLHERIHSSQRTKHQCDLCSKSFLSHQGKLNHTRKMHPGQKVFPCRGCGKHFTNNFTREKHEEKEHNSKDLPVSCTQVSLGEMPVAFITKNRKQERAEQLLEKQSTRQRAPCSSVDSSEGSSDSQSSALALASAPASASAPDLEPESAGLAFDSNILSTDFGFPLSPLMHDSALDTSLSGLRAEDLLISSAADLEGVAASLLESVGLSYKPPRATDSYSPTDLTEEMVVPEIHALHR